MATRFNMARMVDEHTLEELSELERQACAAKNMARADKLRWAITHKLAEMRRLRGDPVNNEGYSGRQSKKR